LDAEDGKKRDEDPSWKDAMAARLLLEEEVPTLGAKDDEGRKRVSLGSRPDELPRIPEKKFDEERLPIEEVREDGASATIFSSVGGCS